MMMPLKINKILYYEIVFGYRESRQSAAYWPLRRISKIANRFS